MQSHAVHQLIHDEGCTGHIARILHQRNEEVENQYLGQEHDDSPHSTYHTVNEHRAQWTIRHSL